MASYIELARFMRAGGGGMRPLESVRADTGADAAVASLDTSVWLVDGDVAVGTVSRTTWIMRRTTLPTVSSAHRVEF